MRAHSRAGIAVTMAATLGAGFWLIHDGSRERHPPLPPAALAFAGTTPPGPSTPAVAGLPRSAPTRLRIPAIHLDAPITGLGLDSHRHLQPPPDTNRNLVVWYKDGPSPGQTGTAILYGHVDTARGPAVFWNLATLHPGDQIQLQRTDGTLALFTLDAIAVYRKDAFPDRTVYGPTTQPELRLITCGGTYTNKTGYQANVVAYAHLTRTRPAAPKTARTPAP